MVSLWKDSRSSPVSVSFSNSGPFLLIPTKARVFLIFTQMSYYLVHAKHIHTSTQKNSGGGAAKAIGYSGSKKNLDHFRGL